MGQRFKMDEFYIHSIRGLSEAEAEKRLREEGRNELPSSGRRSILAVVFEVIHEPMFLMLIACGVVYLLMGKEHMPDALMLLGFVFIVMGITIYQERRTERALEALKDLSSPRALIIRDSQKRRIAGRDVARGDFFLIYEGDRIPADAILLHGINLAVDESLLTGESVPVRKSAVKELPSEMGRPGGDDLPFLYSGSLVTSGYGVAQVLATGLKTELGKIGKALQSVEQEKTLLQKETGRLVRNLAIIGLSFCALVVIVYGLTRGNNARVWKEGFLAGITMAMATLPEEFPVVLTVFLTLGAWRISRKNVLTRRMPAIETLGAGTVLCVDKTGTLTQNKMSVRQFFVNGSSFDTENRNQTTLPETFHEILEYGILASKMEPFDPMEKALTELGIEYLAKTEHLHSSWRLVHEYPLTPALLALSHVWRSSKGTNLVVAAKGAPEAIGDLCHFEADRMKKLSQEVTLMANHGLRVLGVAKGQVRQDALPGGQHDVQFTFIGLVGLADPLRLTVPDAINECYTAGVRVVMITGDYPGTAQSIAKQMGLKSYNEIITGPELDTMSDEELVQRIDNVNIFARVVPEQKLRVVRALKYRNEIVAMTGDGVNDAPALKSSHIGIAMGGRGTDVARESAALVLLDDDFSSIVAAIRLGRRIFDNIKKAVSYIFAVHVPIAGLSVVPVFFADWPLILLPVHVVFLELIIDPACSLIFEAEEAEPNVMTRPPRNPKERLFNKRTIVLSLMQGFSVLAVLLLVFSVSKWFGRSDDSSRALTFTTLVVANLGLILTNRSWSFTIISMFKVPNSALWWVVSGAAVFLAMVLSIPFMRKLFHFAGLNFTDLVICLSAGVVGILWFELLKVFQKKGNILR
jgi:P-type Ca2+ transporter type 2C